MKKIYIAAIISVTVNLFSSPSLLAQDTRYTQSYANPLHLNPAIMGESSDMKFILNYRSQWSAISKGYTTYSFTGMYPIFLDKGKSKLDIGISAMNDKAGAFSTLDLGIAVDYNKEIAPNNNLCLAIIGSYVQKSLDASNLTYDNQYVLGSFNANNSSKELTLNEKSSTPDLGFGFMWYLNPSRENAKLNAFLGFSGFHLNQPNQTFIGANGKLPMRFNYQGGVKIFGENKIDITPNVRVSMQNGNVETAAGMYVDYNFSDNAKFVVGAWYRRNDAIAFLVGFEHKNFTLGYSYDMINTDLNKVVSGIYAHEITLSYKLSRLSKSSSPSIDASGSGKSLSSVRTSPFSSF